MDQFGAQFYRCIVLSSNISKNNDARNTYIVNINGVMFLTYKI